VAEYSVELHDLLFPSFSREDVKLLLPLFDEINVQAGGVLFYSGDAGDKLFFVLSGQLAVQKKTGFAEKTQVVALLGSGAPVGERALLGNSVRGATLLAVKDSRLLSLSKVVFDRIKGENSQLAMRLLELLLTKTALRLEKISDRLAHVL